jgi:hypothetical protein
VDLLGEESELGFEGLGPLLGGDLGLVAPCETVPAQVESRQDDQGRGEDGEQSPGAAWGRDRIGQQHGRAALAAVDVRHNVLEQAVTALEAALGSSPQPCHLERFACAMGNTLTVIQDLCKRVC